MMPRVRLIKKWDFLICLRVEPTPWYLVRLTLGFGTREASWRVELDKGKNLTWKNDRELVSSQPARNWWQRVEDIFFMGFPKELY